MRLKRKNQKEKEWEAKARKDLQYWYKSDNIEHLLPLKF